jgi:GT2 family glycosyltransferase
MLRQSLAALLERTEDKPDQVVIVNGGGPEADEVVHDFRSRPDLASIDICLFKTTNKNLATSRNVGLPHCKGEIIAMTDDDAEVFPDWIAQLKRAHAAHPEAGAIGGPVFGANKASFISRVADRVTFPSFPDVRPVRTLPGVNISYKRTAVERIGPQDETLFRGEDVDYNWRVKRFGYEILFDPEIRVLHHHRSTLKGFLNQHYMYGRAYYRVRLKWPEMYCVYPHTLRRPKDLLKGANYVAAVLYEPLFASLHMDRAGDKLLAYPLLVANQLAWRAGMVRERAAG